MNPQSLELGSVETELNQEHAEGVLRIVGIEGALLRLRAAGVDSLRAKRQTQLNVAFDFASMQRADEITELDRSPVEDRVKVQAVVSTIIVVNLRAITRVPIVPKI